MKVSQLIEALQQLPQDADVVAHASNHNTRPEDSIRVGVAKNTYGGGELVVIGNWAGWAAAHSMSGWELGRESLVVLNWGDKKGTLIRQRNVFVPEHQTERKTYDRIAAEFKFEDV